MKLDLSTSDENYFKNKAARIFYNPSVREQLVCKSKINNKQRSSRKLNINDLEDCQNINNVDPIAEFLEVPYTEATSRESEEEACISLEVASLEENTVEDVPGSPAMHRLVDYHLIDEQHPEAATNVVVCSTLQDIASVKQRKVIKSSLLRNNTAYY